jgi:hypothetical protein
MWYYRPLYISEVVYAIIGLIVAAAAGYFPPGWLLHIHTIAAAIVAVVGWPLILLGMHVTFTWPPFWVS